MGTASAWARKSHIVIQVLLSRLKGKVKHSLQFLVDILVEIFLVAIWVGTLQIMKISYPSKTTALEISISYFYLALFVGISGTIIFHTHSAIENIKALFLPKAKEEEGKE